MRAISSRKRQYQAANKQLTADQVRLVKVEAEMAALQKEKERIEQQIEKDRQNKVTKGMLYYTENQRTILLDKADGLQYSKQTIQRLRAIDEAHWNADFVNCDTIDDFAAVEKYVNDNEPTWERSPFARLGKLINGDG